MRDSSEAARNKNELHLAMLDAVWNSECYFLGGMLIDVCRMEATVVCFAKPYLRHDVRLFFLGIGRSFSLSSLSLALYLERG
jgi:hypothetical protein